MSGKYYWFLGDLFIGLAIIVLPVLLLFVMQPPTSLTTLTTCTHNELLKPNILKRGLSLWEEFIKKADIYDLSVSARFQICVQVKHML